MSVMAVNHKKVTNPAWVKQNIVIARYVNGGAIQCITCGGPVLTQRELADVLGVKLTQLSSYLHGRMVRPDVVAKIRAGVQSVHVAERT